MACCADTDTGVTQWPTHTCNCAHTRPHTLGQSRPHMYTTPCLVLTPYNPPPQVRTAGEQVSDSYTFTVDGTPPITRLSTSLPGARAVSMASSSAPGSPVVTATNNITFTFTATDLTLVTFQCYLLMVGGTTPYFFRSAGAGGSGSGGLSFFQVGRGWGFRV